jgi:hypothetical protein
MKLYRECLELLIFGFMILPAAFATGAGKSNVACQGTIVSPTDDIVSIINHGQPDQTFCIEGEHRITSSIQLRSGQSLIGTTTNSRISGAVVLSPWQATSTQGVYYYDGPYARTQPHQQNQFFNGGANVCYWVTTYEDDLFFRTDPTNDQRIMRVLSETEVDPTQSVTTQEQAVTAGEVGRFFFDYVNQRIYLRETLNKPVSLRRCVFSMPVEVLEFVFSRRGPLRWLARDQQSSQRGYAGARSSSFFRSRYRFTSAHTANSWLPFFFSPR